MILKEIFFMRRPWAANEKILAEQEKSKAEQIKQQDEDYRFSNWHPDPARRFRAPTLELRPKKT